MIRVLFVCHGNICRSTMAQFVFQDMVNKAGLSGNFHIDSAATSREEIGNPPHHGTVRKMKEVGIPVLPHRAVQMTKKDYENYDYLIGMDSWNIRNMLSLSVIRIRKEKWPGFWILHPGQARILQIPGIQAILTSPTGM